MGTVNLREHGAFPPERFIAALTDFGADRSQLWGNSHQGYLKLHRRGDTWAEVTEGSSVAGGTWQRLRYDWSRPGVVRLDVIDSNAFGKGSYWEYRVRPDADAGTWIDLTIHRVPTTLKGRALDLLLSVAGRRYFGRDLSRTARNLEQLEP